MSFGKNVKDQRYWNLPPLPQYNVLKSVSQLIRERLTKTGFLLFQETLHVFICLRQNGEIYGTKIKIVDHLIFD